MESEMRLKFAHRLCGESVVGVRRTVVTRPEDYGWPKDEEIRVPYCTKCKALITVGELEPESGR